MGPGQIGPADACPFRGQVSLGLIAFDLFLPEEIPIQFVAFDLLWRDGESFLNSPLAERRQALESLAPFPACLRLSRITAAHSVEDIEATFSAVRARNNEGLMIKDPASVYTPGRRGLAALKLKKALATLDCVVVGVKSPVEIDTLATARRLVN